MLAHHLHVRVPCRPGTRPNQADWDPHPHPHPDLAARSRSHLSGAPHTWSKLPLVPLNMLTHLRKYRSWLMGCSSECTTLHRFVRTYGTTLKEHGTASTRASPPACAVFVWEYQHQSWDSGTTPRGRPLAWTTCATHGSPPYTYMSVCSKKT